MATFKELSAADISTTKSGLNQLIDIIQEDVSGSTSRRKYQVFVTGGVGPGVTSSLFHTVYDQDYSLQTANAIFDMTVGLWYSGSTVLTASTGLDSATGPSVPTSSLSACFSSTGLTSTTGSGLLHPPRTMSSGSRTKILIPKP